MELAPGYRTECDGSTINIVDTQGYRVASMPNDPSVSNEDSRELCETLFWLIRSQAIEREYLRERLAEAEAEREKSDRIAEGLYEFFSSTARRIASRNRALEGDS